MSVLGNRVLRREDPKFLTVGGSYTADVRDPLLDGAAYATYVRSQMAHARIEAIDTSEALAMPGVLAVFTADDLDLQPVPSSAFFPQYTRPLLARDTVRFVGDPIAVVLTETPAQGEDAAEAVIVDYDPLPVLVDVEEAATDATLLYPEVGTNICHDSAQWGVPEMTPADDFFAGCDVVVRQRAVNQRVAAAPLEVRSAAAAWSPDGRVHQWLSTQHPQAARDAIAATLPEGTGVRVVAPDVGGGFGAKIGVYPEEILLAQLAKRAGRPVRWLENRTENMLALGHGRGQTQDIEIGGTRDGQVLAYRLTVLQDAGAAPSMGSILPTAMTKPMAPGVYAIPKVEFKARAVLTNTCPTVSYRGAGRPEATAAVERAMDLFAAEIGMDPVEVRRINLIPPFAEPYTTSTGSIYDNGDYAGCLDTVLAAAGYSDLRAEQAQRRANGDATQLGIGVSIYVEITGAGAPPLGEAARVVVHDDGSATVYAGTSSHGQGHATAWAMIVSSELGIPIEQIDLIQSDTDLVPVGGGTFGSRSLQQGGASVLHTSQLVAEQAKQHAADVLEAAVADVVLDIDRGVFHVSGTPAKTANWAEVAVAARAAGSPLDVDATWNAPSPTYPFGAHVAVVEVDTETGNTRLVRHIACDDAGRILNPLIVDGQVHGGIAQGAAQALYEGVRYDEDGNAITSNFADYAFPSAAELPSYERVAHETPTPVNPLGAKGIGESGTIGSTPAVQSAVADALAHLGVRHVEMPATPETVWRAINAAQK